MRIYSSFFERPSFLLEAKTARPAERRRSGYRNSLAKSGRKAARRDAKIITAEEADIVPLLAAEWAYHQWFGHFPHPDMTVDEINAAIMREIFEQEAALNESLLRMYDRHDQINSDFDPAIFRESEPVEADRKIIGSDYDCLFYAD